jgi:protein SCO1/2
MLTPRSSRARLIAVTLVVVVIAISAAIALSSKPAAPEQIGLRAAEPRPGGLPISFDAPQFEFPDQDDGAVSTANLRGRVTIVDFIFTHCANTCPKMTAERAKLQKLIADPRVTFLSISVDPERDDKPTRKTYAKANGLDESRWRFVSPADREAAIRFAQQMKIAAAPGHGESPILHSDRFLLIDSGAKVRGAYAITDLGAMDRLVRDATALAGNVPPNSNAAK